MPIPESTLAQWSHHRSAKASKQAHVSIRQTLAAHNRPSDVGYEVFLQGSYKNGTNLRRDSDVDLVVRLAPKLSPSVAALSGEQLQENASHEVAYRHWRSFRRHALKVMRALYGDAATSGRKTLKLEKGELQADADLVITLSYKEGIGFYLPDERRWVVSFPQQHHDRGAKKEKATSNRFKRIVRMFKAARNRLVEIQQNGEPIRLTLPSSQTRPLGSRSGVVLRFGAIQQHEARRQPLVHWQLPLSDSDVPQQPHHLPELWPPTSRIGPSSYLCHQR